MRRLIGLLTLALVCALPTLASAQTAEPAGDLAVGYSLLSIFSNPAAGRQTGLTFPAGWGVSTALRGAAHVYGVVDTSGAYRSQVVTGTTINSSVYTFAGGIRIASTPTTAGLSGFGQFLVGGSWSSASIPGIASLSSQSVIVAPGFGVTWYGASTLGFRAQGDLFIAPSGDGTDTGVRVSLLAVVHW